MMEYEKNFIETKIIYENDFDNQQEFALKIEEMFVDGATAGQGRGWHCIQCSRLKSGIRFYIFMREIAE